MLKPYVLLKCGTARFPSLESHNWSTVLKQKGLSSDDGYRQRLTENLDGFTH